MVASMRGESRAWGLIAAGTMLIPSLWMSPPAQAAALCGISGFEGSPAYYAIDMVSTKRVAGSRSAYGVTNVTFTKSPFGVAISDTGNYVYDLSITIDNLRAPRDGVYVGWVSTPDIDRIKRLGPLNEEMRLHGQVQWNKFLVIISLEEKTNEGAERWQGPIVLRGMSRSGRMHTMAGHGPFQAEPCVVYGYR